MAEVLPNLWNPTNGPILRQLYIRQAMEYLINRPVLVSKVFAGYADPGNGPVPVNYAPQWDTALERSGGPSNQIDHVPSSRMRARSSFAIRRSRSGVRSPR